MSKLIEYCEGPLTPEEIEAVRKCVSMHVVQPPPRTCDSCRHWEGPWKGCERAPCRCSNVVSMCGPIATSPRFGCVHHEFKEQ